MPATSSSPATLNADTEVTIWITFLVNETDGRFTFDPAEITFMTDPETPEACELVHRLERNEAKFAELLA